MRSPFTSSKQNKKHAKLDLAYKKGRAKAHPKIDANLPNSESSPYAQEILSYGRLSDYTVMAVATDLHRSSPALCQKLTTRNHIYLWYNYTTTPFFCQSNKNKNEC